VFHNENSIPLPKGGKAKGAAGQLNLSLTNGVLKFAFVGDLLFGLNDSKPALVPSWDMPKRQRARTKHLGMGDTN
jgi:hypothetical protein